MSDEFKKIALQQQGNFGEQKKFVLLNKNEIKIIKTTRLSSKEYVIHLLSLAEKSKIKLFFSKPWFISSTICFLLVVVYLLLRDSVMPELGKTYDFLIITALMLSILISVAMFVMTVHFRKIYLSRYARVPLFDFLVNKPDKQSYKKFIDSFDNAANESRQFWKPRHNHQVAGEMRMLRRLSEEGIINKKTYEIAKNKLFKKENKATEN